LGSPEPQVTTSRRTETSLLVHILEDHTVQHKIAALGAYGGVISLPCWGSSHAVLHQTGPGCWLGCHGRRIEHWARCELLAVVVRFLNREFGENISPPPVHTPSTPLVLAMAPSSRRWPGLVSLVSGFLLNSWRALCWCYSGVSIYLSMYVSIYLQHPFSVGVAVEGSFRLRCVILPLSLVLADT